MWTANGFESGMGGMEDTCGGVHGGLERWNRDNKNPRFVHLRYARSKSSDCRNCRKFHALPITPPYAALREDSNAIGFITSVGGGATREVSLTLSFYLHSILRLHPYLRAIHTTNKRRTMSATIGFSNVPTNLPGTAAPSRVCRRRTLTVRMLKVPKSKRPAGWDGPPTTLSGRFLPMDPRDEMFLDNMNSVPGSRVPDVEYGSEGPPASAYSGNGEPGRSKVWNKRAAAAKRRWEDPEYRVKMLQKRRATRNNNTGKINIGACESITLVDDERAKEINAYARSNRLKSEKISFYHRDRKGWMESRLNQGEELRHRMNKVEYKKQMQEKRQEDARLRHARMRAKKIDEAQLEQ